MTLAPFLAQPTYPREPTYQSLVNYLFEPLSASVPTRINVSLTVLGTLGV
jgi:hypothetical protein